MAEITYVALSLIRPYENNPRRNEKAVLAVQNSIREFGFKNPIILDKDNVIVSGHTRFIAANNIGMDTVPCIYATDLTDEQIRAFRLADNRVAEVSEWDNDLLAEELADLKLDFDMTDFGFSAEAEALSKPPRQPLEHECPKCGHRWSD